jgi:hypothetical protein
LNINGLFDVHSTGAILFSTSHGTSGQILRSNGNAAPTWVDASTVIGGPYLPLTGGTLTGPLSGTSATFAGNITTNGDIIIDNSSGDPFLKLKTVAQEYVIRIDQSDSEKFQIRNVTSSVNALSIDTSSNSTFTGSVRVSNATQSNYWLYNAAKTNGFLLGRSLASNDGQDFFIFDTIANSARLTIDSSGNVGINDTSPNTANLSIKGQSTGVSANYPMLKLLGQNTSSDGLHITTTGTGNNYYAIKVATGANSSAFNVTNAGNVGIGTDSPRADAYTIGLTIGNTTTGAAQLVLEENTLTGGWRIFNNGYLGFIANNDERMRIDSSGNVNITGRYLSLTDSDYTYILGKRTSPSDGFYLTRLMGYGDNTFYGSFDVLRHDVNDGELRMRQLVAGTVTDVMTIVDGNVGIGTTSPNQKLDINGNLAISGTTFVDSTRRNIYLNSSAAGGANGIFFRDGFTYNASITAEDHNGSFADGICISGYDGVSFSTGANTKNERMRIDISGNVGIGVTSPQTKLQTNLTITGNYLSYLNGTSATFDAASNIAVVHNSPSIGSATAAGLVLANNDKSNGAPSPIIAFSAKSASNSYNHTYAAIYGVRTATGADTNWTKGDIVLATGSGTGPSERMRVLSSGGITFNGDTAAANALDDYEEGTFTVRLQGSGGQPTHSVQAGFYTKIGNVVTCVGTYTWSGSGSNANITTKLEGFPFVNSSTTNARAVGGLGAVNGIAQGATLRLVMDPGHAGTYIIQQNSNNYTHNNTIAASGAIYGFSITYRTS